MVYSTLDEVLVHKNDYIEKVRLELREFAMKLLNDDIYFIEGIREIKDRLDVVSLDDEDCNLFRAIDSDTDDVPVGASRSLWNKEALQKIDDKIYNYITSVKPQVKVVCKKIIKEIDESLL
ncbi:MAG: hypothetical protein COW00_02945 [Bdellovibrio sp. CG12_big_fil_rev_8_21_14_0_65_39_13]|nr:MAG: hypothetical protein COW78_13475 [Bdellovibrio sp. CG22_combo_CG10-13_8_21_14_all_39_27]PIQ61740.1 MAG: hypothetical protein COW00_02945 [Bdellovibrio sp. CG12_big_fil_rev_8_21_14_0_65_39_13]PIR34888.1 MAG: hypothetical protein COV37_11545 [Bdellovibrio sp. CG11_big_fil_rev_8_21_14_0_20_39_38]PJB54267.1 MAG: hypothetical protein CO099_02505 [Bdellovibrio sp. CG_4_9_14_3_um_filter_39_7]